MLTQLLKQLIVAAMLLVPHAAGLAAEQSTGPNTAFERSGTVDEINLAANQIIINDRSYGLASNVPIHEGNRNMSRGSLRKGMRLNFNTRPGSESGSGAVITEIWVSP